MTLRDHPQRLTPQAAPGALFKRFRPVKLPRLVVTETDAAYLALIRQLPCLKCMMEPSEAAHVRMQSAAHGKRGGIGKKPADRWTLPLCSEHHREQHKIGELQFYYDLNISPLHICEKLHAQYVAGFGIVGMRAVIFVAIAERESSSQGKGLEGVTQRQTS